MASRTASVLFVLPTLCFGALLLHCVGDDPGTTPPATEGGTETSTPNDSSGGNDTSTGNDTGTDSGPADLAYPVQLSASADDDISSAHVCARYANGKVYCWGHNPDGKLGVDPTTTPGGLSSTPVAVTKLDDAIMIAAGVTHSCAIKKGGTVVCWGANAKKELGNDAAGIGQFEPIAVVGLPAGSEAVDIATGYWTTCAVLKTGALWCWGFDGQYKVILGDGTSLYPPTAVDATTQYKKVRLRDYHVCGLVAGVANTRCWGANGNGTIPLHFLGRNDPAPGTLGPGNVSSASGVQDDLGVGIAHACVFASDGARCWGNNQRSQQGTNVNPVPVATLVPGMARTDGLTGLATGEANTCGVYSNGTVKCVGAAEILGGIPNAEIATPTAVAGLADATQVVVGIRSACAIRKAGGPGGKPSVACWGKNTRGQLGDGTTTDSPVAVQAKLP